MKPSRWGHNRLTNSYHWLICRKQAGRASWTIVKATQADWSVPDTDDICAARSAVTVAASAASMTAGRGPSAATEIPNLFTRHFPNEATPRKRTGLPTNPEPVETMPRSCTRTPDTAVRYRHLNEHGRRRASTHATQARTAT